MIKDSGKRQSFKSGMVRDVTDDKIKYSLLIQNDFPLKKTMFYRWALHLTNGAKKYADRNWEKARSEEELNRFKDSAFRHFMQWYSGEEDEDHAAAVFFNINGVEYTKERLNEASKKKV